MHCGLLRPVLHIFFLVMTNSESAIYVYLLKPLLPKHLTSTYHLHGLFKFTITVIVRLNTSWDRGYKTFFILNSTGKENFNAHKHTKYQEIKHFSGSDKPRMLFSPLRKDCWHINIYEREKFHAQLSKSLGRVPPVRVEPSISCVNGEHPVH